MEEIAMQNQNGAVQPQDEFRYNKEFNLEEWVKMEPPPHMSEGEWIFAVYQLHTLLMTEEGMKDPATLKQGWMVVNHLI
jgi:hypothetical protein